MKIKVTSRRGHHEADVMEPEVIQAVFNKMTGKTLEPLPDTIRQKLPDTFHELEALWNKGKMGYSAVFGEKGELTKEFDPNANTMLMIAPQAGG